MRTSVLSPSRDEHTKMRSQLPKPSHSASPYLIGAAIGVLNVAAFATFRKGIGVSGAFESSAALAARQLAPDAFHINDYVKQRSKTPSFDAESWLVVGTILGGMLAAQLADGDAPKPKSDHPATPLRSPLASVTGGALLMYGARMAGGCTSGHSLSGTAQGAASSWIFTPLMFVVGAVVARVHRALRRKRDGRDD